jgi:hypothetical protein
MLQKVGMPSLSDGALLKNNAYIDGAWLPAATGQRFAVAKRSRRPIAPGPRGAARRRRSVPPYCESGSS